MPRVGRSGLALIGAVLTAAHLCAQPPAAPSNPPVLDRTVEPDPPPGAAQSTPDFVQTLTDPPLGFTGRSSVVPSVSANIDFVPVEDRWRIGFPEWDRYGRQHPFFDQYPYVLGRALDPYAQN